jgi:hypothetical protein
MILSPRMLRLATALALLAAALLATPAAAADWPHWRGPNRDDTTSETSGYTGGAWLTGPPAWAQDLGGTSETTPVAAGGRLYTMTYQAGKDTVFCLDGVTGKQVWKQSYPCRARGRYAVGDEESYQDGPQACPEYDEESGYLYTLGIDGDLNCWDTRKGGARVWGFNLYDRFGAKQRPNTGGGVRDYGYSMAPIVAGKQLIVEVGAPQANLMAFDKMTGGNPIGKPTWISVNKDPAGDCGGMAPMTVGGVPCLAVLTLYNLLVVRLDAGHEGATLGEYPFKARFGCNIVTPSVWQGLVVLSSHMCVEDVLVQVTPQGIVKIGKAPHTEVGTPVFHDGRLYKCSGMLECWALTTTENKLLWRGDMFGDCGTAILTADKKLIVSGANRLALYALDGKELAENTSIHASWPHLVLADGRLYCKNSKGQVRCYLLSANKR